MTIDPCQSIRDGKQCDKLDTKPYKILIDHDTYRYSYQIQQNYVMVDICDDCAKRMKLTPEKP